MTDVNERGDTGRDGCGMPIALGQHYIRMALMLDTAGLERYSFDTPSVTWSGIVCTPGCLLPAAGWAILQSDELTEPFS